MMTEKTSEAPKPPPRKRALFNKPSWSRPLNLASPADFFHRGNSANVDTVTEAARKRKAKAAKKEAEKARQKAESQPAEKRLRVSRDDDDLYGVSDQDIKISYRSKSNGPPKPAEGDEERVNGFTKIFIKKATSPRSSSKCYGNPSPERKLVQKSIPPPSNIIDLEDSEEDEGIQVTQVKKPPPPEEDDFPASDEEYAELARKAREKARRKRLQDDILVDSQKQPPTLERDSVSQQSLSVDAPTPPPSSLDPEVYILVTSRLENSVPLIIKRRLSQRLKDVRVHWCSHNQFTEDMMSSIFLTWRGKRLFDVTSCKSLGIAVDKEGRVMAKEQDDILAEEDRKIHMEAMTEEVYEKYQKCRRRATEQQDDEMEEEQTPVQQKPQEDQIRLILKGKGFPDFKLIAKPVSLRQLIHICKAH